MNEEVVKILDRMIASQRRAIETALDRRAQMEKALEAHKRHITDFLDELARLEAQREAEVGGAHARKTGGAA